MSRIDGQCLADLAAKGVLIDEFGLLKPDLVNREAVLTKIAPDLVGAKRFIDRSRENGKHVVYLPGSYDLIHAGHASYVDQAVAWYLSLPENVSLGRQRISVALLADDDDLIARTKASKWIGAGGTEAFRRPVQSEAVFRAFSPEGHWRLIELASLPQADIVGFIPSPAGSSYLAVPEVLGAQRDPDELRGLLTEFEKRGAVSGADAAILRSSVDDYASLLKLLATDYAAVAAAFERSAPPWSLQSWQLLIHSYLAAGNFSMPFVRIVSNSDAGYKDQVNFIMTAAGIRNFSIEDRELFTTTDLVSRHGHEALLAAKRRNYAAE